MTAPTRPKVPLVAELSLVAAAAIWGFTFPLVKDALRHIGTFEFLAVRFWLATLVLAALWPRTVPKLVRGAWRGGLLAGALLAAGHAFQTAGLDLTRSTNAGFITGLYVLFTPLIAWIFLRRHVAASAVVGVVLTTFGLAFLSLEFVAGRPTVNNGDLLVLVCAVAYGGQIVAVGRYSPEMDTRVLLMQQLVVTAAAMTVLTPAQEIVAPRGWVVWNALLATALGSSAFGIGVQTWAQRRVSPTRAAVIFAAEAPFAALFAYLLADERLPARAWFGAVLILGGMLVVAARPAPATREA